MNVRYLIVFLCSISLVTSTTNPLMWPQVSFDSQNRYLAAEHVFPLDSFQDPIVVAGWEEDVGETLYIPGYPIIDAFGNTFILGNSSITHFTSDGLALPPITFEDSTFSLIGLASFEDSTFLYFFDGDVSQLKTIVKSCNISSGCQSFTNLYTLDSLHDYAPTITSEGIIIFSTSGLQSNSLVFASPTQVLKTVDIGNTTIGAMAVDLKNNILYACRYSNVSSYLISFSIPNYAFLSSFELDEQIYANHITFKSEQAIYIMLSTSPFSGGASSEVMGVNFTANPPTQTFSANFMNTSRAQMGLSVDLETIVVKLFDTQQLLLISSYDTNVTATINVGLSSPFIIDAASNILWVSQTPDQSMWLNRMKTNTESFIPEIYEINATVVQHESDYGHLALRSDGILYTVHGPAIYTWQVDSYQSSSIEQSSGTNPVNHRRSESGIIVGTVFGTLLLVIILSVLALYYVKKNGFSASSWQYQPIR